jgi:hypothetical protein
MKKLILIVGGGVVVVAAIWFATVWFKDPGYKKTALSPPAAVVQREAEELRAAVKSLESLAQEAAAGAARTALADGYLTIQEEKDVPRQTMTAVGEIKARAPYPAVLEGFTFPTQGDQELKVAGFSFEEKDAVEILENEFTRRRTAVKERELIDRLRSLLRTNTDDRWLEDKEAESVLRFITTPEPGKQAGLRHGTAVAVIDSYCKDNHINRGNKPEPPRR